MKKKESYTGEGLHEECQVNKSPRWLSPRKRVLWWGYGGTRKGSEGMAAAGWGGRGRERGRDRRRVGRWGEAVKREEGS